MSDKRKIILNNVFPDATYNTGNNLYHETINMFQDDDGNFFIHLNPNCRYNYDAPDFVLNIVKVGVGLYKILSKAKVKEKLSYDKQGGDMATYGNVSVGDLFVENRDEEQLYATFRCSGIFETKKDIYLQFPKEKASAADNKEARYALLNLNETCVYRFRKTRIGQSLRVVNIEEDDLNVLQTIINNNNNWQDKPVGTVKEKREELEKKIKVGKCENYFSLLGVDKKELQYSNAIVKILQFREEWISKFLEKAIHVENCKQNVFEIKREEENTDILFRDLTKETGKIVIIENKVEAGLTLSKYNNLEDQAKAVFRDVFAIEKGKEEKDRNWENFNNKISAEKDSLPSQLSKYYLYALCWAIKAGWSEEQIEKNIYCFFLCPNYHEKMYAVDNNKKLSIPYVFAGKYKMITYSTIKVFFEKVKGVKGENEKDLTPHQKFIVEDFIDAISVLAKDRDDSVELSMIRMFMERHDKLQKLKNK